MKWIFLFHLLCTNGQVFDAYTTINNFKMSMDFIHGVKLIKSFNDVEYGCVDWNTYPAVECKLISIKEMYVNIDNDLILDIISCK